MAHPNGGSGSQFRTLNAFEEVYTFVGPNGYKFRSTTEELITATRSLTKDKTTPIIVFNGEQSRHGSVCKACWGFRIDCSRSRIGQCAEALDLAISKGPNLQPIQDRPPSGRKVSHAINPAGTQDKIVTIDDLAHWRRAILRIIDALEDSPNMGEGLSIRVSRLIKAILLPREIASCMRVVTEMRNAAEYQGKQLSSAEQVAARNAWLVVEA